MRTPLKGRLSSGLEIGDNRRVALVMPETRYARTADGVHIAYQEVGSGPFDLIFANSWASHIEFSWSRPAVVRFYSPREAGTWCR